MQLVLWRKAEEQKLFYQYDMRILKLTIFLSFLISLVFMVGAGCSSRSEKAIVLSDSTITYPSKIAGDISAVISLCRKIDKKSGKLIGEGTGFTIMEKTRVHALAEIANRKPNEDKELMFHFNWIGPDGKLLYKKRIDLLPNDSSSIIKSTISISPETRQAGEYIIQLYFFRELIAEKKFELYPKFQGLPSANKMDMENITLFKKIDKKTGKRIGEDSVFTIANKEKIRAFVNFKDRSKYGNRELLFRFDWYANDTIPFYKKRIDLLPNDTSTTIGSAISISPGKRQAGDYTLRLYLFNELISEKSFELLPEQKTIPVNASIVFYQKMDKKSGKRIGEGTKFTIGNKKKVRAYIKLKNRSAHKNQEMRFLLEWIGPDGKSFYHKKIKLAANDPSSSLKSSISISPGKRQAGEYLFRISLSKKVLAQKKFVLVE